MREGERDSGSALKGAICSCVVVWICVVLLLKAIPQCIQA